jgi:ATP adenylyltransferase
MTDRLWAPWRKAYLRPKGGKPKGCIFCRLLAEKRDAQNYILKRTAKSFALLNLYPYNNGHVMIVPLRHVDSVHALTNREKLDWLDLYEEVRAAIKAKLKPHGFNVGINLGRVGGAGIPHHLHLHVVPRWRGDANFMPVISDTKVMSESLDSVYHVIRSKLKVKGLPKKSR